MPQRRRDTEIKGLADINEITESFALGMNLPWIQYGRDFGSSDGVSRGANRARLREDLSELSSRGLRIVRWFVFSDGREGLKLGSHGRVAGLSDGFLEDFQVSLEEAHANGVALMPCLLDFLWFSDKPFPSLTPLIEAPEGRKSLIQNAVVPLLDHFGQSPAIFGWDAANEPEWAMKGVFPRVSHPVEDSALRSFVREIAREVHERTRHPVTLGAASTQTVRIWRNLDLDFFQVHYYPWMEPFSPLSKSVSSLRLDRPVLLGEFPTSDPRGIPKVLNMARKAGYMGALGWSKNAESDQNVRQNYREVAGDFALWARKAGLL